MVFLKDDKNYFLIHNTEVNKVQALPTSNWENWNYTLMGLRKNQYKCPHKKQKRG